MTSIVTLPTGFQVRYNIRGSQYDSKHFTDRKAAEAFKASLPIQPRAKTHHSNNRSGMSGIRVEWRSGKLGEAYPTLAVFYRKDSRSRSTTISLNKHGIEDALKHALQLRGEEEQFEEYLPLVRKALR